MLTEGFFTRFAAAFPSFYARVDQEAAAEARRLLQETDGDVAQALSRARLEGAGRLWWPYVRGSVPVVGDDLPAMQQFARIVLTVDHLVGHPPASMDAAREHALFALRRSLDVERLAKLAGRENESHAGAATAGFLASAAALWAPISGVRRVTKAARWLPTPVKWGLGALVVASLASVPIVAGYSAGRQAERAARGSDEAATLEAADGSRSLHNVPA